jgi:methylmalonyl-CoA/ethylmalonyl-CoA epimerase
VILGIDHLGVATEDPRAAGTLMALLGMTKESAGTAEDYGVSCEFWQFGADRGGTAVELVAPVRDGSAVATRLAGEGPGLYHVAFEVSDLDADVAALRGHGFLPVDKRPCAGARDGMRVRFLYIGDPVGLLVELVQYDEPRRTRSASTASTAD